MNLFTQIQAAQAQTPTQMPAQLPTQLPQQAQQALPLRDIKLPAEPGFWPLAPGWWLVIVLTVAVLTFLGYKWYQHRQKKQRWLAINDQLAELELNHQRDKDQRALLTGISLLLRRFVKHQLNQHQATTLAGSQWIDYLNQSSEGQTFSPYENTLTSGVYQAECDYDAVGLIATTREFMRNQVMKPKKNTQANLNRINNMEPKNV